MWKTLCKTLQSTCVPRNHNRRQINVLFSGTLSFLIGIHCYFGTYKVIHLHEFYGQTDCKGWPPLLAVSWTSGLHKLWYPVVRDMSTWSKFGAHGGNGDVFLFSNLGALWFSENLIIYSLHVCLREVKNNLFSSKHSYLRHFSWRF